MLLQGSDQSALRAKPNLVLAALFSGTFVLGTAELIVVGLLDLIAADLQVSHPAAGALVTANALGLALGGPVLTALTIKLNKRTVLTGALGLFVVSTLAPVLITDYGLFVTARSVAGGVAIGTFTSSAAVLTGLVLAAAAIVAACATSFLKPLLASPQPAEEGQALDAA